MLEELFSPGKVAVVGASRQEGKTGHEVFDNLLHGFEGEVVPVNPNADEIHGRRCEDEVPEDTDLAVVVVPAPAVPEIIEDIGRKGVGAAIVVSAGFSETGNEDREAEIVETARNHGVDLLGPNVLGLINTENRMNASFAARTPEKGNISFMSQSGAFCTAILDYADSEHIGFRHFVSLGNKALLNEVDMLKKWREDDTEVIISYTEGIEDGREFMEEARKTSRKKPIVMIKSGRTDEGSEAASTHTGSIAGSYEAYKAAFRKSGIIEAESNRELLDYGRALSYQPLPEGEKVAIVTNAGGPGVVAADEVKEHGLELSEFSEDTVDALEESLPDEATPGNPLDVIGDAGHERYKYALENLLDDSFVDSVIVLLTPQANTEIEKTARTVVKTSEESEKPVMACFMGEKDVSTGKEVLEKNHVPVFSDPVDAVKVLGSMNRYRRFRERDENFYEVGYDKESVEELDGLETYSDRESFLSAYDFDFPLTVEADSPLEAERACSKVGQPVVVKAESSAVSHRSDIGAVKTGLEKSEVKEAYHGVVDSVYEENPEAGLDTVLVQEQMDGLEIALGLQRDPQFGPMVMVGLGGIYVEALRDVSFGIAPISDREAEEMIDELRSHELFEGIRGEEHSMEPVKEAIIKLGELGLEHDEIESIDINPLILNRSGAYVADLEIETR